MPGIIGSDGGNADVGSLITTTSDTYNRELILDLTLGAFALYDIGHPGFPTVNDYCPVSDYYYLDQDADIVLDDGTIVDLDDASSVVVETQGRIDREVNPRKERIKYLTTIGTAWTLSEYKDYRFRDWVSHDEVGADFFSYLITGYEIDKDMMRNKSAPYLLMYCKRTEQEYILTGAGVVPDLPSSCIVQVQWDWSDSAAQGKWGTKFQAYRLIRKMPTNPSEGDPFDYGESVIVTKNKLRGSGRSLSLFIQSDSGMDLRLLGWGLLLNKVGEP